MKMSNELLKGMHSGRPIQNLIGQLSLNQSGGGSYELVNSVSRGGQRHVIFRMVDPNGAMNYHDLRLLQFNGKVCSDQIFVAMTGEDFDGVLRHLRALKTEYNYQFQDLRQVEGYEGLVKSEQFEEWQND